MRFPNRDIPLLEQGDTAMRVHCAEGWFIEPGAVSLEELETYVTPRVSQDSKRLTSSSQQYGRHRKS